MIQILKSWLDADNISIEEREPGVSEVVMTTSGLRPNSAKLKARWFQLVGLPMKIMNVERIETVHRGIVFDRYKITGLVHTRRAKLERNVRERVGLFDRIRGR